MTRYAATAVHRGTAPASSPPRDDDERTSLRPTLPFVGDRQETARPPGPDGRQVLIVLHPSVEAVDAVSRAVDGLGDVVACDAIDAAIAHMSLVDWYLLLVDADLSVAEYEELRRAARSSRAAGPVARLRWSPAPSEADAEIGDEVRDLLASAVAVREATRLGLQSALADTFTELDYAQRALVAHLATGGSVSSFATHGWMEPTEVQVLLVEILERTGYPSADALLRAVDAVRLATDLAQGEVGP